MSVTYQYQIELPVYKETDICIVGGGPGGIAAALAAARSGASVLLIEQRGYLGGMSTVSLVPCYTPYSDHEKAVVRGIGLEILNEMKNRMQPELQKEWKDKFDWVTIEPETLKVIFDEKMQEAGVDLLYHTFVSNVIMNGDSIEAVVTHNKSGSYAVKAKVFIDASGDADLVYHAGGSFHKGDEDGDLQPSTMCFVLNCLDKKKYDAFTALNGSIEKHIVKAREAGELKVLHDWAAIGFRNNATAGFNFGHVVGIDGTNTTALTNGNMKGRALVQHITDWLRKNIPGFENAEVAQTGEQIGIRETRRIVGEYVVTVDDFIACRSFPDDIARNAYYLDVHRSKPLDDGSYIEKVLLPPGKSHGIPYRSLIPLGLSNVLVAGRTISADRATQGSLRVMPTCFAFGEAAGIAASIFVSKDLKNTRNVDISLLQRKLIKAGAWLGEEVLTRYDMEFK